LSEEERAEIRSIEDPFTRKEEILKRIAKFTHSRNKKMKTLEDAGSPPVVMSMFSHQDYYKLTKGRVLRGVKANLLHGVYDKDKLIGVSGVSPWNPIEFLKNPASQSAFEEFLDQPYRLLFLESQIKFALIYLNHPKFENIRKQVKPNQIVIGGPHGILNEYKGSKLGERVGDINWVHAYNLGYKLEVGWASNPITARGALDPGSFPLLEASIRYPDFYWKGKKPFESIIFKSVVPNGDSMWLCMCTLYEDLRKEKEKKNLTKSSL